MDYDRRDKTAARHDGDPLWEIKSGVSIALDEAHRVDPADVKKWSPRIRTMMQKAVDHLHHADRLLMDAAKELDRS